MYIGRAGGCVLKVRLKNNRRVGGEKCKESEGTKKTANVSETRRLRAKKLSCAS